MIEQVQFANFKSFEFPEPVALPPFVVLVGDNGAGKTNFCDAFSFARHLLQSGLRSALLDDERRQGFENVVRGRQLGSEIAFRFDLAVEDDLDLTYRFGVGASARTGEPQVLSESLVGRSGTRRGKEIVYLERDAIRSTVYNELGNGADRREKWDVQAGYLQVAQLRDRERFPVFDAVRQELGSVLVLRPDAGVLRRREQVGGALTLGDRGQGLVSILDAAPPSDLDRLARLLAEGDPSIKAIELLPAGAGHKEIGLVEHGQERPFGPHQISDGTLRLLVMLAAITGVAPGVQTLIVEEPENGIHYSRLRRLVELCRKRVVQDKGARILLTTHSIPLLHALQREEAMAVVRDEQGISRILPPPDPKRWQRFREEAGYTIGDLYATGLWPQPESRIHVPRSTE